MCKKIKNINCPHCKENLSWSVYKENVFLTCMYCDGVWVDEKDLSEYYNNINTLLRVLKINKSTATDLQCPKC